jgi:hypothetical protein
MTRLAGWLAIISIAVVACQAEGPSSPGASAATGGPGVAANLIPRRTDPTATGPNMLCAGVGLEAVLQGGADDPEIAWLVNLNGVPGRHHVVWPSGYAARFGPGLQVLDASGHVVIEAGDYVDGGCVTAQQDVLLLEPPFLSLRLQCGPVALDSCGAGVTIAATDSGWPQRSIATLTWLAPNRYLIGFEDGSQKIGTVAR